MVSANEIPAGGEGRITLTTRMDSISGPIRQSVQVITNVPEQEQITLTVLTLIARYLEADPVVFQFPDNERTDQVVLKSSIDTPIEITNIAFPDERVKLAVSAMTIPPKGEVMLTVELPADLPAGIFSGWVEVQRIWNKYLLKIT